MTSRESSDDLASTLAADLSFARSLADIADSISLPRFEAADLRVDTKPDMTPVSDADLAVERALRSELALKRPDDAIIGEEFADELGSPPRAADMPAQDSNKNPGMTYPKVSDTHPAAHGRCWVIDPIDGTKNFVRGVPIWATLIALLVDGHPVVGVVSAPGLARRWWGADGLHAWTQFADDEPRRCHVSGVTQIADASMSIAQPVAWEGAGRGDEAANLSRAVWRTRGYGDFYSHMLVAQGAVDIAGEPELSLWDLAALAPIITAAGGRFTGADGAAVDHLTASALTTNGLLHEVTLGHLTGEKRRNVG